MSATANSGTPIRPNPPVIRDAACAVIVDQSTSAPRLLLGRRHAEQVFLPNKWVFPGGRVDQSDRDLARAMCAPVQGGTLQGGAPGQAGTTRADATHAPYHEALIPFALAAVREVLEETGHLIAHTNDRPWPTEALADWQTFARAKAWPSLSALVPVARAVTPPDRPRRYDTWFFLVDRNAITDTLHDGDGELLDSDWFALEAVDRLDLPNITRRVLTDAIAQIGRGSSDRPREAPYYFEENGAFQRQMVAC